MLPVSSRGCWFFLLGALALHPLSARATEPPDLVPNGQFLEGGKHWKRYTNFVRGDVVSDWSLSFERGEAIIEGSDCQPQSRVGFRSDCISLEPALKNGHPTVFRLQLDWAGRGIHRSGFYFILNGSGGRLLRQGEVIGPAGDFDTSETLYFQVPREDLPENPCLTLYAFHDGAGRLAVHRISLVPLRDAGPEWFDPEGRLQRHPPPSDGRKRSELEGAGPVWVDGKAKIQMLPAPERSAKVASTQLLVRMAAADETEWDAFESKPKAITPLLPGERRLVIGDYTPPPIMTGAETVVHGDVGLGIKSWFWDYAVARYRLSSLSPFGLQQANLYAVLLRGTDSSSLPPLQPLPATRSAYLYFYGQFRYGGKPQDLARDKADMAFLRDCGITGLCIQDNYGLDYARWADGKPLDPAFLMTIAQAYKDAGFPSPLVFALFAGLDKGRVRWDRDETKMKDYLAAIAPHLRAAEKILGPGRLWIAPIDEPNDADRRAAAMTLLPVWKRILALPLVITVNWHTSGDLQAADHLWVGAGDYPSFDALHSRNITGFYCGIDSNSPLRMRWLAGVHAWASGLSSQAYWHFDDVHGSPSSDLDDDQEDFRCMFREGDAAATPTQSLSFLAIQEGLMDLRLLCALDSIRESARANGFTDIDTFLDRVRASALPTDRLAAPWNTGAQFRRFRNEAARLWIAAHNKPVVASPPPQSASSP